MQRSRIRRTCLLLLVTTLSAFLSGTALLVMDGLHDRPGKADVALVLGNTVQTDGAPSPRLQARLDKTLQLYREGDFPWVIASGGLGKEGFDEAVVMRAYLVAHGIPGNRVIVDSSGLTTFASAERTAQIAQEQNFKSVFVVSQYFHIPRTRLALKRFGIGTVYSAHPHFFEARDLYSAPRELIGYLRYAIRRYDQAPR